MLIFGQGVPSGLNDDGDLDSFVHGQPILFGGGFGNFSIKPILRTESTRSFPYSSFEPLDRSHLEF